MTTDHDWDSFARIIDVGGAYGSFLAALLLANKQPRGVLFDQEQVRLGRAGPAPHHDFLCSRCPTAWTPCVQSCAHACSIDVRLI